jgi:hypothetical protein
MVDHRSARFSAWITSGVLVVVLISGSVLLLAAQTTVFAVGAFVGPEYAPYCLLFRTVVAPWLTPGVESEPVAPLRFAQGIGFTLAGTGLIGHLAGVHLLGTVATAMTLNASFLNAAFGFCVGCAVYLRLPARLRPWTTDACAVDTPSGGGRTS